MKSTAFSLVNSQIQQSLLVSDRGVAYGDGVFETMYVQQGDIALWQYHYERLEEGLCALQITLDRASFSTHIEKAKQAMENASGVCKLTITRGQGGRGYLPVQCHFPTVITQFYPFDKEFLNEHKNNQQQGVAVHCCETLLPINPLLAGLKTLNQLPYVLASQERLSLNVKEGILFDTNGQLIEATARNIFLVKGGAIYTPELHCCGVAGVMRRLLIEKIAPELNVKVYITPLLKEDFLLADEVFLLNSISHLWPVVKCNSHSWPIGNITQKAHAAFTYFFKQDSPMALSKTMCKIST